MQEGSPRSAPMTASPWMRWSIAIVAALVAMGARGLLNPWFGNALPFVFAFPAVALVAWVAGLVPALAAALLCAAWALAPGIEPSLDPEATWLQMATFLPSALLVAFVVSHLARRPRAASHPAKASMQTPAESELSSEESSNTLKWLRATMWLGALVPLVVFLGVAWYLHGQAVTQAKLSLDRTVRVAEEHARKVFETDIALLNRTLDLLGDEPEPRLLAREPEIHEALKHMTSDLPQLQGIFVMGPSGHMVATNRMMPAPHQIDYSDRRGLHASPRQRTAAPGERAPHQPRHRRAFFRHQHTTWSARRQLRWIDLDQHESWLFPGLLPTVGGRRRGAQCRAGPRRWRRARGMAAYDGFSSRACCGDPAWH